MDNIKLSKNFFLYRKSMRATLVAFKANKTVADMTLEVFQVMDPAAVNRSTTPAPTLALVPAAGGSRSAASRTSIPAKVPTPTKSLAAFKLTSKEPIALSESTEGSSEKGIRVASLDVTPLQAVGP